MSEDILHQQRIIQKNMALDYTQNIFDTVLYDIQKMTLQISKKKLNQLGLHEPKLHIIEVNSQKKAMKVN